MRYRYPGIHSFTADDRKLFFGRDREIKELFRLIVLNEVVVLFGKSGTGKTSLLQAGVAPSLHERLLEPVKLRLNNTSQPISRQLYEQLNDGEYLPLHAADTLSLWEYCKLFEHNVGGESYTPVLLLDQFEELFTLYHDRPDIQQHFVGQLADVINGKTPAHVQAANKNITDKAELARRLAPPQVNIVISIRSDYLYLLDRLSGRIPAILRCRYELPALDETSAYQAITRPAALPGDFASKPFTYSPAALTDMVNSLTTGDDGDALAGDAAPVVREVEAFQVQLLCRFIEQKIIDENQPEGFEVSPGFYGGKKGIEDIRSQFYAGVLEKFDPETRPRIQRMVEDKLLSNDRRIIQEREFLKLECGVSNEQLTLLTAERLLKEEPRSGSFYYEISHDALVTPILKARQERKQSEEAEQLKKEAAELAERERILRRKQQRNYAAGIVALALLAFSGYSYFKANSARQQAYAAEQKADAAEQKAELAKTAADEAQEALLTTRNKADSISRIADNLYKQIGIIPCIVFATDNRFDEAIYEAGILRKKLKFENFKLIFCDKKFYTVIFYSELPFEFEAFYYRFNVYQNERFKTGNKKYNFVTKLFKIIEIEESTVQPGTKLYNAEQVKF